MRRAFLSILLIATSAPALADVTGRYSDGNGPDLIVEVSDEGRARVAAEGGVEYTLLTADEAFIINTKGEKPTVTRWNDMMSVFDQMIKDLRTSAGFDDSAVPEPPQPPAKPILRPAGTATVEGRSGTEYIAPDEPAPAGEKIVVSDDPKLAPLGRAWSRFFILNPTFGRMLSGKPDEASRQLSELVKDRAPLQMGDIKLIGVSFEDVADERFALPAEPLTPEQVKAMIEERKPGG